MRHSDRAKRNSRLGIDARIAIIKANVDELKREKKIYENFKRRGLNAVFCNTVIKTIIRKIAGRISQLNRYEARRRRWLKNGFI